MEALRFSITNKIHKIVLDSPKSKNAISLKMYEGITKALNTSSSNESVVATVITGSGDFYSSGNDIKGYMVDGLDFEKKSVEAASILEKFVASFVNHSKILIAVVNGPAIGIAATTLALCDYVIASDKAYFYTPFTSLGLSPEGCSTHTFPRLLGARKATEMLLFNHKMSAQEAFDHGFVNKILPHSNINEAWTHIDQLLDVSHESLLSSKKLLWDRDRDLLLEANSAECKALVERWKSEDFIQQLMKFFNKKSKL